MTLEELKAAFPDVYSAIEKAGHDKGFATGLEQGRTEGLATGTKTERERIQAVEAQSLPGHEALIAQMKFDGVTTGPEAAVKILAAEKAVRETKLAAIQKDESAKTVPAADGSAAENAKEKEKAKERAEAEKPASVRLEAIVQEKMKADPKLSYTDALKAAQQENRDLAQAVAEEIGAARLPA